MTLDEFRQLTKDLPGDCEIMYNSYHKGCCLSTYSDVSVDKTLQVVIMNPNEDYDGRKPQKRT